MSPRRITPEITAELPGLDENNVEVAIADDVLTIKGEKKVEGEEKAEDYYRSEVRGELTGRRVVRGREVDCRRHYLKAPVAEPPSRPKPVRSGR